MVVISKNLQFHIILQKNDRMLLDNDLALCFNFTIIFEKIQKF